MEDSKKEQIVKRIRRLADDVETETLDETDAAAEAKEIAKAITEK